MASEPTSEAVSQVNGPQVNPGRVDGGVCMMTVSCFEPEGGNGGIAVLRAVSISRVCCVVCNRKG